MAQPGNPKSRKILRKTPSDANEPKHAWVDVFHLHRSMEDSHFEVLLEGYKFVRIYIPSPGARWGERGLVFLYVSAFVQVFPGNVLSFPVFFLLFF